MSQATNVIPGGAGVGGLTTRTNINNALAAIVSVHGGSSRPSYAVAGMLWWNTSSPSATVWTLNAFDGTNDVSLGTLDTVGHVWSPAGGTVNYALASGFVNKLRNGSFVAWPNGTSGTIAAAATGSPAIAASGWAVQATGASVTLAQVQSGNNGAPQSLKVTGNTSVTDVIVGQRIESSDAAPLAGKVCTFQMAVFNNTGASITPTLRTRYANTTDSWGAPVTDLAATNQQACPNSAWTIVSYSFTANANAVNGYEIEVDFGNNFSTTGKYVQISAADLRATPGVSTGLNASPPVPEFMSTAQELVRSARYFQTSYNNGVAPGTATRAGLQNFGNNGSTGATNASGFTFAVHMRASPTMSYWDGAGNSGKCSRYTSGAWTDNAGAMATLQGGEAGVVVTTGATANVTDFAHFTAYADFW